VIYAHVAISTCDDYARRRAPHRDAHIERLVRLRAEGTLVAGGPSPDGTSADLFYRLAAPSELARLVEEDPYYQGGVWTAYTGRGFRQFVEPWEAPPVVLDGSRRVTIVEGPADEPDLAQLALVELRGARRLLFGGLLDGTETLAVMHTADPAEALAWLGEPGPWAPDRLRARPYLYVL
jgi:hypothetical protein